MKDDLPQAIDPQQQRRQAVIKKVRNPETFTVLSTAEVSLYFEVEPRTVYRWMSSGKLRAGGRSGTITIESVIRFEKTRSRKRRSSN